jgi:hypothetical protein
MHQSPQKLKALREHALIESAVSYNRIEGVEVEQSRIGTIIFGQTLLPDREEEETPWLLGRAVADARTRRRSADQ